MTFPLMHNNITKSDLTKVINFLKKNPVLTQNKNVEKFEKNWSKWLGVKYSVFVNSGSSANLISMSILKEMHPKGEVLVPTLTWVSDIASVIQNNLNFKFIDINPINLCMDENEIIKKVNSKTVAVFMTYAQGFNGLSKKLLNFLKKRNILLIEDVCESHGAKFENKKLGSFGLMSNFSFYYAHHMSTIEGGMVSTNDKSIYEMARMYRSHGMVREVKDLRFKYKFKAKYKDLNPEFIFAYPAYNLRNNEINAIIGINQLKKLDNNNLKRTRNLKLFLNCIDHNIYRTNFDLKGSSNYAFPLILKEKNIKIRDKLEKIMFKNKIEFRRGSAGGGNQIRQPYIKKLKKNINPKNFMEVEHIHFFGYYIGNYPSLSQKKIRLLCKILNSINE